MTAAGTLGMLAGAGAMAAAAAGLGREATEQRVHARCGRPTRVAGGAAGLDNDWVNGLCTAVGAAAGAAAALRLTDTARAGTCLTGGRRGR